MTCLVIFRMLFDFLHVMALWQEDIYCWEAFSCTILVAALSYYNNWTIAPSGAFMIGNLWYLWVSGLRVKLRRVPSCVKISIRPECMPCRAGARTGLIMHPTSSGAIFQLAMQDARRGPEVLDQANSGFSPASNAHYSMDPGRWSHS